MNIFVYSDESGVFDKEHNDYFVFAGLIILDSSQKDIWSRKYAKAEKTIRERKKISLDYEIKATNITNAEKGKLFRALNTCYKFAVVITEKRVLDRIYRSKKDKQRYLDYAYKIAVKRSFIKLMNANVLSPSEVEHIYFYVDEHTTATNGKYELQESLEQEFKRGTYNYSYDRFYPPIFSNIASVTVEYCNSKNKLLVRAADIVANRIYYLVKNDMTEKLDTISNLNYIFLP